MKKMLLYLFILTATALFFLFSGCKKNNVSRGSHNKAAVIHWQTRQYQASGIQQK